MQRNNMDEPATVRIVLLGKTGSGKSSAGNTILHQNKFKNDTSLESVTKTCESGEVQIDGKRFSVIDTPGLFDTTMTEQEMKNELMKFVKMSVPGPHVFLLVIRLDVKFTDEEKNTVKQILENFGESARYTIILFTHNDVLDNQLFNYISESKDLQALLYECGGRFHSFNSKDMENRSQVTELLKKIEKLVEDNGRQHYSNEMYEKAQKKTKREALIQQAIDYGKTALSVIGVGAVAVVAIRAAIANTGGTAAGGGTAAAGVAKLVEVAGGAVLSKAKL